MDNLSFSFSLPTKIHFGEGLLEKAGDEVSALGGKKAMIVTDPGVIAAGIAERVMSSLRAAGIEYIVFDRVKPNPRDYDVEEGYRLAVGTGVDVLVGVGGGSAIDTAKAIGVLVAHGGGRVQDYVDPNNITQKPMPLVAIPTTAGTGTEVTTFAIITDTERKFKMGLWHPYLAPTVALVDPSTTKSVPPALTASTGLDALTHAIEAYTCKLANPVTDALAIYAIRLIARSLRRAVENGSDVQARTDMMLGSMIAGMAFGASDVGGAHAMGEAIGGKYDVPHGVSCAIFLPYITEFNMDSNVSKYADVAIAMGVEATGRSSEAVAREGVEAIKQLCRDLKVPSLKEVGVRAEDFEELAEAAANNVSAPSNPKPAGKEEYLMLFKRAWDEA